MNNCRNWIDINDKLPEFDINVLTTFRLTNGEWAEPQINFLFEKRVSVSHSASYNSYSYDGILTEWSSYIIPEKWMPLPEPNTGDKE